MKQLDDLGIEYQAKSRYNTVCPKCSSDRRKKNTKSLCVFVEPPFVRYMCFHPSCEWNTDKQQYIKIGDEDANIEKEKIQNVSRKYSKICEVEKPFNDSSATYYRYRNRDREIVFLIVRRGDKDQKWIRPFAKSEIGEWVMERPSDKVLYRSEFLRDGFPVIVVEGEKTADAAAEIFTQADVVTWVGGAGNTAQGDWALLDGKKVILWPDNDDASRKAMSEIAGMIRSESVHMANVSSLPDKADLADDISKDVIGKIYQDAVKVNIAKPLLRGLANPQNIDKMFEAVREGLPLGWAEIDRNIRLPLSGIVVVQGRTNHGKSALMINMAANLLTQTDTNVVYLSYEMSIKDILLRFTKTLDGSAYSKIGYEDDKIYQQMISNKESPAFDKIKKYMEDRRLMITDVDIDVEEIVELIKRLSASGKPLVVFLDYIQLVPSKGGRSDQRYLEVKKIAEKLRHAANTYDMVVVQGSQLTAGESPFADAARESKDIEFTASLVLKIWNKSAAQVTGTYKTKKVDGEEVEVPYYDHVHGDFIVEVKKTRQGGIGKAFGLNWTNGCKLVAAEKHINTAF